MDEATPSTLPITPVSEPAPATGLGPRWLSPLVLCAAALLGAFVYYGFCQHSRDLWWWMGHDRHTHYMFGLNLALDIRTGELGRLFHDFDRMRVWPPLQPLLIALVELIGGPNHQLAVLPSLAGWVLTMWCAFLIPRRLLTTGGDFAGLIAAFLVTVSPAHRAFATDVMHEGLGAGLSLAIFYLYLATLQEQSRRYAIGLGLTLSALFFHKYNYWALVCFGLIAGKFLRQPKAWLQFGLSLCRRDRLPAWIVGEFKQPLNYIALIFASAAAYVAITGGGVVTLGGRDISLTEPHNFVHFAYIALFLRAAWWWFKAGQAWSLAWPATLRPVLLVHGSAMALWFLMPKRLSYFLWYLGPTNNDQVRESLTFMHGLPTYIQGAQEDYLTLPWGLYLLVGLVFLALVSWPKFKPGAAALFCFLLIATYLTCQHPMVKHRLMHSWIAMSFVLAAAGAVFAVQEAVTLISRDWRPWAAALCCAILIGLHVPGLFEEGRAQEGGLKPREPSPLKITDTYLPALADAENPTIVSNVSTRFLWTWTFIEYHHHQNMSGEIKNFKSFEGHPEVAKRWLETTRSDALVLIDIKPQTMYDWPTKEYVNLAAFHQALGEQNAWTQTERWDLPEGVSITIWRKRQ